MSLTVLSEQKELTLVGISGHLSHRIFFNERRIKSIPSSPLVHVQLQWNTENGSVVTCLNFWRLTCSSVHGMLQSGMEEAIEPKTMAF